MRRCPEQHTFGALFVLSWPSLGGGICFGTELVGRLARWSLDLLADVVKRERVGQVQSAAVPQMRQGLVVYRGL